MYKVKITKSFNLKSLVTKNHKAFSKHFYLRQAVNCSLWLFENSYDQKYIFVKDFQRQFNTFFSS